VRVVGRPAGRQGDPRAGRRSGRRRPRHPLTAPAEVAPGSAREVFGATLRLGLTSFGGPIAHIGYQRRTFVVERGWLDEDAFGELVALCQTLPGPASSQLTIAVGRLRAGWAGALAAWLGFTLPSFALMTALGIGVATASMPTTGPVAGAAHGLEVAAVAIVASAVLAMARVLTPDAPRLVLAALAAAVLLAVPSPFAQVAVIAAGGLAGLAFLRGTAGPGSMAGARPLRPVSGHRSEAVALLVAFVVVVVGSQLVATATGNPDLGLVAAFVRAGALVFGGGHVVLPLLDAGIVRPGWVTENQFLAGYGAAQALPGPLFSFAAFLGAVATVGPGGVLGAAAATVAIFLPGALLVLAALPVLGWLRGRPGVAAVLAGVNAAVVGVLAAALVNPVATGALTSPFAALVAAAGTVLLVVGGAVALGLASAV
jgi:chromate transporter